MPHFRPRGQGDRPMTFPSGIAFACAVTLACALPAASLREAGAVTSDQPREAAHREPAWKHPQRYPRPSPDRVYLPPAPRVVG